jgi:hypothetical protein
MSADDGRARRLTNRPGNDLNPAWAASGDILFNAVLSSTGNQHIHKMKADAAE